MSKDGRSKPSPSGVIERHPFADLERFQAEQAEWAKANFGDQEPWIPALGASEEVGELVEAVEMLLSVNKVVGAVGRIDHAILKTAQGIRGDGAKHDAEARDAIGDILVYLTSLCTLKGWSIADVLDDTWSEVQARDWQSNPESG